VYALFGEQIDSQTKQPLFNVAGWKKAKNVLGEIIEGYASDPPGLDLYHYKLDSAGNPKYNSIGMPLLHCLRGTNITECHHKQMLMSIGTWATGIEMSDAIRTEHRHRYNHRMCINRRAGYPSFGHYDTWMMDALQKLVFENHNTLLYPNWSSTLDIAATEEEFGTTPLHDSDLTKKIQERTFDRNILTAEELYLADCQGVQIPFTPVTKTAEKQLFTQLMSDTPGAPDFERIAMAFAEKADGKTIMPKHPVYLRNNLACGSGAPGFDRRAKESNRNLFLLNV
jgi:hypothetical protein